MSILDKDSNMEDHWGHLEPDPDAHKAAVTALYQQMKPLLEQNDAPVVMNTLMIVLAMVSQQTALEPELFKAFVVSELDRLMAIAIADGEF
jgi:hypothetical protein